MGMHLSSEECTVLHVLALYCTALHCCLPKGNWTRYLGRYILCLVHIVWAVSDKKYSAVLLRNAQSAQRSAAPERPRASPAVHTRRLCCRRGGPARQHRRRVERDRDLCMRQNAAFVTRFLVAMCPKTKTGSGFIKANQKIAMTEMMVGRTGGPSGSVLFCAGAVFTTTSSAQKELQSVEGSCQSAARVVFSGVTVTPRER